MNIKKPFIKIIAAVLLISCILVSVAVFYKSREPAEPVKTERQLREEVLQRHLESKGRSRTEPEDTEPLTADVFVIDSNTAPPPDMPADAIVVTSPEDINSAIADYLSRSEPNEEIRMVDISEVLEERRLAQIRNRARNKQIISDERINKIIEQGVRDGILVVPSGEPGQQLTDSLTAGEGGVGTKSPSASKMPAYTRPSIYPRTSSKNYKGPAAIMGGYSGTGISNGLRRPAGIISIQPSTFGNIDIGLSELTGNKSLAERLEEVQKMELQNLEGANLNEKEE